MTISQKPHLLIVGGGCAGVVLATKCSSFADVTLVDPKGYFEVTWATIRGIVDSSVASRSCFSYQDIPNIGKVVQASVTRLTSKDATLSTGEVLTFDFAAICSGSSYSDAFKSSRATTVEQRLEDLKSIAATIREAKSVVVVGGGPAGVETAAEIVEAFAGKSLTIVHPGPHLLNGMPPKGGALATKWLQAHGVKLLLNTKVTSQPPSGNGPATLTLSSQQGAATEEQQLATDLVLWCAGARPTTGFLSEELADACRDERGQIKVLPTLQLVGHPHMFALGDCSDVPETKMGFLAMQQAELAVKSLRALVKAAASGSGKVPRLGTWTPGMGRQVMLVTLGRNDGLFRFNERVCGGWFPAFLKSKTLFVDRTRAQLGVRG